MTKSLSPSNESRKSFSPVQLHQLYVMISSEVLMGNGSCSHSLPLLETSDQQVLHLPQNIYLTCSIFLPISKCSYDSIRKPPPPVFEQRRFCVLGEHGFDLNEC